MNNPTLLIKRSKEDLRRFNIFHNVERHIVMRVMTYLGPMFGISQMIIFTFIIRDYLYLAIGVFLLIYPFFIRRTIRNSSDQSFEQNNIGELEIKMTFNDDEFVIENDTNSKAIKYSDIFKIYNKRQDIFIYLDKQTGLSITKEYFEPEVIERILELLRNGTGLKV